MILPILIYLLFSVPLFVTLLSWRVAGDAKTGWKLPPSQRGRFMWLTVGFALALPAFLGGASCSIIAGGSYIYSSIQRTLGAVRGENYDIVFLFVCGIALVLAVAGFWGTRACWRRLRPILQSHKQKTERNKGDK